MANEPNIDVTEERDVTEATIEHELENADPVDETSVPTQASPLEEFMSDEEVLFHSMDNQVYSAPKIWFDWDATSSDENMQNLQNNAYIVRHFMRELLSRDANDEGRQEIIDVTMNVVVPIMSKFGYEPKFNEVFPDADAGTIALLWCIDTLEFLNKIMFACALHMELKPYKTTTNTEEESTNEVH